MRPLATFVLALLGATALAAAPVGAATLTYDGLPDLPMVPPSYVEADIHHAADYLGEPAHWHTGSGAPDAPFIFNHALCCSDHGVLTADEGDLLSLYSLETRYVGSSEWQAYGVDGELIDSLMIFGDDGWFAFPDTFVDVARVEIFFIWNWFGWDNLVADTCPDDDGDGICNADDPCPWDAENDADADGVCGDVDLCAWTTTDSAAGIPWRGLGTNRWVLEDDWPAFTQNVKPSKAAPAVPAPAWTTADTAGCSCAQIIDSCGYGRGQSYYGCSNEVMDAWVFGQMCAY